VRPFANICVQAVKGSEGQGRGGVDGEGRLGILFGGGWGGEVLMPKFVVW